MTEKGIPLEEWWTDANFSLQRLMIIIIYLSFFNPFWYSLWISN
jgi:hypothetical protein